MAIRVICANCGAKMDIRAELAGSTRHCPKCKTEFKVPTAEESEGEEAAADEEVASDNSAAELESTAVDSATGLAGRTAAERAEIAADEQSTDSDEDEDDDYLPTFVTGPADKKSKAAATSAKKDDDDDGPTLSIPKAPPASRPRSKTFDPDAFLNDEPQPSAARASAASKPRPKSNAFDDEFDPFADDAPASPARPAGRDLKLPTPSKAPLSDADVPATGGTRDRAQAARELRQALKDSALKAPAEPQSRREEFYSDLSLTLSEIGPKNFAIFFGVLVFAVGLYFLSFRMYGGGQVLPPLGYVTGNVTLDGAPAVGATVYFQPMKPQDSTEASNHGVKDPRASAGVTDEKGHYKMMYQQGTPGVTIGKCRVWVALPPPQAAREYSQMALNTTEVKSGSQEYNIALTSAEQKK